MCLFGWLLSLGLALAGDLGVPPLPPAQTLLQVLALPTSEQLARLAKQQDQSGWFLTEIHAAESKHQK